MHGIHPIAIRKSKPWLEGRASDTQAQHPRAYLVERLVKKGQSPAESVFKNQPGRLTSCGRRRA
jgi:hypothetical protein